jgi:hypothetical protein
MRSKLPQHGELHIQRKLAGFVEMRGFLDSWYFGMFTPTSGFAEFAALFGEWSLLIHADEKDPKLSHAAADELRSVEAAIDQLRAQLHFPESGQHLEIDQINIDGELIELKLHEIPVKPSDTSHPSPDHNLHARG